MSDHNLSYGSLSSSPVHSGGGGLSPSSPSSNRVRSVSVMHPSSASIAGRNGNGGTDYGNNCSTVRRSRSDIVRWIK